MIPCHDLRTGNVILVNNQLRKVTLISNSQTLTDQSVVGVESNNYEEKEMYPADLIQPVPLTDAILEGCQFKFQEYFQFWQLINMDGTRTEMDIDANYNLIDYMRRPIVRNIASLHQLQNIYFMLLGKELHYQKSTNDIVRNTGRSEINTN